MLRKWYSDFKAKHGTVAEIFRFLIVGGTATVVDYIFAAIVLLIADAAMGTGVYPHWYNVLFGANGTVAPWVSVLSTAVGFCVGLIVNYILSVAFVFEKKGDSRSVKGALIFTVLSVIGLGITALGMYIFNGLLGWNYWVVKVVFTLIVLVYNYVSKRLLLFNK